MAQLYLLKEEIVNLQLLTVIENTLLSSPSIGILFTNLYSGYELIRYSIPGAS